MKNYWVSWYSGYYEDEGCTAPPFQVWITGSVQRPNEGMSDLEYVKYQELSESDEDAADEYLLEHAKDTATIVALVTAENEDDVWESISKHFPDYKQRFIEERELDWTPGDRFLDFQNKTSTV